MTTLVFNPSPGPVYVGGTIVPASGWAQVDSSDDATRLIELGHLVVVPEPKNARGLDPDAKVALRTPPTPDTTDDKGA